jgi:sulfite exporter TauE/SafE/copper chaperone CopZ
MSNKIVTEHLNIRGMTCAGCQSRIEKALRKADGVAHASADYSGGFADISYNPDVISHAEICGIIEELDYNIIPENASARGANMGRIAGFIIIIIALSLIISRLNLAKSIPLAEEGMGYGMLFLIGLLTSVHCVAMCGGINLSQCMPQSGGRTIRASFLYNAGRVASYTAVGFAVGALGSVITFGGAFKGVIQIIAGVFMIIMGASMLGIFPSLNKLVPRMPSFIAKRAGGEMGRSKSPLIIGLLNGLMPCGPLQAMQLYALSTGSPLKGALSMLLFSLGTVPLMFGLGVLASILTKKFTRRVMTVGAIFVVVLGLTMFGQGAALSGFSISGIAGLRGGDSQTETAVSKTVDGVQIVDSTLLSGGYPKITVHRGVPVKWTINAPEGSINGCNRSVIIPEYGIEYAFAQGENVIEFTPERAGQFRYTCWMGMIKGSITVVEG